MDRRARATAFVVALGLLALSALLFPAGGLPAYEYRAGQGDVFEPRLYGDDTEFVRCPGRSRGACGLVRYARDHDGVVVENATLALPLVAAITDPSGHGYDVTRYYRVHATETDAGTRVTVAQVEGKAEIYRALATDPAQLPAVARSALDGEPTTAATAYPPGASVYLVRHDGEWYRLDRVQVREAGVPWWGSFLKHGGPLAGVVLLTGLWLTGQRAEKAN